MIVIVYETGAVVVAVVHLCVVCVLKALFELLKGLEEKEEEGRGKGNGYLAPETKHGVRELCISSYSMAT